MYTSYTRFHCKCIFNVCACIVSRHRYEMLVVVVYRAPWVPVADTSLCNQLDLIVVNYSQVIIVWNFNIPNARFDLWWWTETDHILCFFEEYYLHILKSVPMHRFSNLDLIFVSFHFATSEIIVLLPMARSDCSSQLFAIRRELSDVNLWVWKCVNYQQPHHILIQVYWVMLI